jgi:hypothetical protein
MSIAVLAHFGSIMAHSRAGEAFAAYNERRPIQLNFEDFVSGLSAYPKMKFHLGKPAQK